MPVSRLNIGVRRPLGSDVTQAPIIPPSQVKTVLRNPPIKRAPRGQFSFYFEKNGFSSEIISRTSRRQIFPILPALLNTNNRFNRYLSPNLPTFIKILKKNLQTP